MTIYKFIDLDCDGPGGRGCPHNNKIQADSAAMARQEAKLYGWATERLDSGIRIDLCSLCKKEE